ncbi:hypothetical protein TNIN_224701 [Trichonephila inaurata madagascariensis]|uniref:Uncharacterized protein n=1 Tax=Trichonephila inaurata madagascariensis TaxID=2747483 RepID=A0A8X6YEX5_9ARAC|nr:hypothetical protein TNIN_224701 [Trichonephila inaurata madagascariensis]
MNLVFQNLDKKEPTFRNRPRIKLLENFLKILSPRAGELSSRFQGNHEKRSIDSVSPSISGSIIVWQGGESAGVFVTEAGVFPAEKLLSVGIIEGVELFFCAVSSRQHVFVIPYNLASVVFALVLIQEPVNRHLNPCVHLLSFSLEAALDTALRICTEIPDNIF